ncbi:MAG: chromosomal replication initiator protein DnaA, partial [Deltaproteobacteria bacterium]
MVEKDCVAVWDSCLEIIRKNVNPQSFRTWFEPIKPVKLEGNVLTIQVPNKFFYEWLEEHFVMVLRRAIKTELGEQGRLEYQILLGEPKPRVSNTGPTRPKVPKPEGKQRSRSADDQIPGVVDTREIKNPFVIPGIRKLKINPQLNPSFTFDTFIEGDCNRLARAAGLSVAERPGATSFNPLLIYGDVGLGKTHLAQAIGNRILELYPQKSVLYVTSEKFTNQIIDSIRNNAISDLVNFYQLLDVLIVDDIQFLGGKEKTQEIFFFIFNQ